MIKSFKHKGLEKFYRTSSHSGILPMHKDRLRIRLAALDTAVTLQDMDIAGFRLHALKGTNMDRWSICISGNWRLTFEYSAGQIYLLDYEDYH